MDDAGNSAIWAAVAIAAISMFRDVLIAYIRGRYQVTEVSNGVKGTLTPAPTHSSSAGRSGSDPNRPGGAGTG